MPVPHVRLPPWLRARQVPRGTTHALRARLREGGLHTVCEEARCPNAGECFGAGTATFLILGDACTRDCTFCAVRHGVPDAPDPDEPRRVAAEAKRLGLRHVVITSVTRDDLPDGGAGHFAACVRACRDLLPGATVEVLIPDFHGDVDALGCVLKACPDVLNHNIETVRALYPEVRPQADYDRSLALLRRCGPQPTACSLQPVVVKSGLMVGLGETREQLSECFRDLHRAGVEVLTIGQYLRPRRANIEVARYCTPFEFDELAADARDLGFSHVLSGPLVRSSYHAAETVDHL
ncbi:MAG: lipoyl synthase [Deltaproteobacteria bacterium]|nr:lipoyl synthase [Deltaproteobacteria bacterium]